MADFETLRVGRRRLVEFCSYHKDSLESFGVGRSFKLFPQEELEVGPDDLRHMTSTATCLESLADCPDAAIEDHAQWFAQKALAKPDKGWMSEGSAHIYCRCRALPLVIRNSKDFPSIEKHLVRILAQLDSDERFAIGEADPKGDRKQWYPPNAFHTFWTLETLSLAAKFEGEFAKFSKSKQLIRKINTMILWAWQTLGCQTALHESKSSGLDTDQLIWALAIVTRFSSPGTYPSSTLRHRDLVAKAAANFFAAQDNAGTWRHHEPLFHYEKAGNAYCFVFESLVPLLKNALKDENVYLRSILRGHADAFFKLVDYAEATRLPLGEGRIFGWSSGHRTNMPFAESWATAAVYECMQALRRLVGLWTREDALRTLSHRIPMKKPAEAIAELCDRADTWSSSTSVANELMTLFVNPVQMQGTRSTLDPDDTPIGERQSRSAILFGPPGTSKTTIVKSVADAIGWDYVELHPSHFVAGGLPNVQRTADDIFTKLMELDRCVVLFDEIDELMREREIEPDAFGRFLTTSMLPKLAELWKQRRVIYFVATNHIGHFDSALTRSQRFDALLLVPPPSYEAKVKRLQTLIGLLAPGVRLKFNVAKNEIESELNAVAERKDEITKQAHVKDKTLENHHVLAKFVLLRWDQLEELSHLLLKGHPVDSAELTVDPASLRTALNGLSDNRLKHCGPFEEFLGDRNRSGRDFGKDVVWAVDGEGKVPLAFEDHYAETNTGRWCTGTAETLQRVGANAIEFLPRGRVRFIPKPD